MTPTPSFRDVEQLSAYLDNQLPQSDVLRLETRLKNEPDLRALLADLSQSRTILRSLPARKAPRNFRLTPEMAGIRPPLPRAFPIFQFASALAAVLFFFAFAANLTLPVFSSIQAAAPAPAMQAAGPMGKGAAPLQPAAPAAGMEAAPTPSDTYPVQPAAPMTGVGVGGGPPSSDTALPEATGPVAKFAPMVTEALTPTPEVSLMLPEPTLTPEAPAATQALSQPGALPRNSASDLNQPQPELPQPEPTRPPVPAWLQFGLLGLAVISGSAAYLLRARSEQAWFKAHALPSARPTARQVMIFILVVLLVVALFIGIALLSSPGTYAP